MRTTILAALVLLCCFSSLAQPYAFNDAMKLRKYIVNGKFDESKWDSVKLVLDPYLKEGDTILAFTDSNSLFRRLMPRDRSNTIAKLNYKRVRNEKVTKFGAAGGLDVTMLADGLARFMVKRAKEELNVAFFERFKNEMTKGKYKDAITLFPETSQTLLSIGERIYMYQTYLPALQESFQKDLRMLPDNLPKVIEDGNYRAFFEANPVLKYTCLSGIHIANGIDDQVHPGMIIQNFPAQYIDGMAQGSYDWTNPEAVKSVAGALKLMQLVSVSLKAPNNTVYWHSSKDVKDTLDDKITANIYLALLYQQGKHIKFGNSLTLKRMLDTFEPNFDEYYDEYTRVFTALSETGDKLQEYIDTAKNLQAREQKPGFDLYYKYFNGIIDIFALARDISVLPGIDQNIPAGLPDRLNDYVNVSRAASNLVLNVRERNFSSGIINTYTIYSFAFRKDAIDEYRDKYLDKPRGGHENSLVKEYRTEQDRRLKFASRFGDVLLRTGSFMSAVSSAKNSEDVSNAIEATVLPAGSSRHKREVAWNISLNGFIGPFGGHEWIKNVPSEQRINTYGLLAPVGIAASRGRIGNGAITLFVSLIDVGTVAAFRAKDSSTSQVPVIQLKDIVAPGVFAFYGIPKTPLAVGGGYQFGPRIRNTDIPNAGELYHRLSFTLAVDIPFLNFASWQPKRY